MRAFSRGGTSATSLRHVAAAAGVSVGLVQHHFGTKAQLIEAVDNHVMAVIATGLAAPARTKVVDPVGDFGHRVSALIAQHTDVIDYLGRAFIEDRHIASALFDGLVAMGRARWEGHKTQQLTRPDLDTTWAAMNPIILALGAILLRSHIDRQIPEPFTAATQLARWEDSVNNLIREGQLPHGPEVPG